jgi:hypothetical protein
MQLLRNHQGGAFSLPDALRGLGLRRIDLDMNEANDRHGILLAHECWRRGGIRIDEHLKIDHESHRCGSEFRSCVNAVRMPHEISTYLRTKSVRTAGTTLKINLPCEIN